MVLICKDEETEKQEWKMGIINLQEDENEEILSMSNEAMVSLPFPPLKNDTLIHDMV